MPAPVGAGDEARVGLRIAYIAAGAGGMYCGACARDIALVRALMDARQDVQILPLYTPMKRDDDNPLPETSIYFGGINVYLQQATWLFKNTPSFLDRLFDLPFLLNWAGQFSVSTRPAELGPLTVSMLAGREGHQRKELHRLTQYLHHHGHPDVVVLTNSLLSGIAPEISRRVHVPVACMLQGEDRFISAIPEPYRTRAWRLMRRNAQGIELFIAPHPGYAAHMAHYLDVPPERIRVVRAGIDPEPYRADPARGRSAFRIGYLSAITPSKGLDILVEALRVLAQDKNRRVQVSVAGRPLNQAYWKDIQRFVQVEGLGDRFEYVGELEFREKLAFLHRCSIFCLPTRIGETRGMAVLEAMASGLPVVVPHIGIFPDMIARTQGGLTFTPDNVPALVEQIIRLQDDPQLANNMGYAALAGVEREYSAATQAQEIIRAFRTLLPDSVDPPPPPAAHRHPEDVLTDGISEAI